ncbi:MAG: DUF2225 domain-containing protein [Firmicutes bacterium]|nr:DUF2225 domain-containing protein [Bacillota bacterium]
MAENYLQSYSSGTVLFSRGDASSSLYFLLEGTILASGEEESVELGMGAVLGELAFFKKTAHFYTAICATDVKVLEIRDDNLEGIFRKQPRLALSLIRELAQAVPSAAEKPIFFQGVEKKSADSALCLEHILPEGHPILKERVSAAHEEYLFRKKTACPICGTEFSGARTRHSRLQAVEHLPDFRIIYRDFDPNLYYIWVCPHCLFAYPERQYNKIPRRALKRGKSYFEKNPPGESFVFDGLRTMHQVIVSYYLAARSFEILGANDTQWANLWLRLVWIYEDLKQKSLMREAAKKSLHYFQEAMSKTVRSAAGDQQLYIIMAELSLRLGEESKAYRNLHRAATLEGGNPRYKHMAADRIQDLRR